mmetsp:Transcript_16458/g.49537  ORF Transcript_16458/g.49537 Transcript_16458/m.49537 type:complete len:228 (+) Transcript_16458:297-980(+)
MCWPSFTARGSSSISRVCHQCVRTSQGDVESTTLQRQPSKWASNQPATPWSTQVALDLKSKVTSKSWISSGRRVRKSKYCTFASALSWSGWNWSLSALLKASCLDRSCIEESLTPWKSPLDQRLLAFTRRPWWSLPSSKGARQKLAPVGKSLPPGFRKRSRATSTVSMPLSAKRKFPSVSCVMQSTFSGTSSRMSCNTMLMTTILSDQPLSAASSRITCAIGDASTQ